MIFGLFGRRKGNRRIVADLYETLTAAARMPQLYERGGVPDTVIGRFEMLAVHMVLFLRRAEQAGEPVRQLAQDVVDRFFEDIDHSIRELGIGDAGVPRRMKRFASMFYGRAAAYGPAVEARDADMLAAALARNVRPDDPADTAGEMEYLARHVLAMSDAIEGWSEEAILRGAVVLDAAGPADPGGTQGRGAHSASMDAARPPGRDERG